MGPWALGFWGSWALGSLGILLGPRVHGSLGLGLPVAAQAQGGQLRHGLGVWGKQASD